MGELCQDHWEEQCSESWWREHNAARLKQIVSGSGEPPSTAEAVAIAKDLVALRQQLAAAEAREAVLREALTRFAAFYDRMVKGDDFSYMQERVADWLCVSDFKAAASALSAPSPHAEALLRVVETAEAALPFIADELACREASYTPNPTEEEAEELEEARRIHGALSAALAAYREAR